MLEVVMVKTVLSMLGGKEESIQHVLRGKKEYVLDKTKTNQVASVHYQTLSSELIYSNSKINVISNTLWHCRCAA